MNKFLIATVLCAGLIGAANPMKKKFKVSEGSSEEVVFDLGSLITTNNDIVKIIVCFLDAPSFLALQEVYNEQLHKICNGILPKHLGFTFCDAAECRNKKLIDRFVKNHDEWMFEPEIGSDENNSIKIVKRSFGASLHKLLDNCSFYCVSQNDAIVRYAWFWNDPEMFYGQSDHGPVSHCVIYLNAAENSQEANELLVGYLKDVGSESFFDAHSYSTEAGYCNCFYIDYSDKFGICKSDCFRASSQTDSAHEVLKRFGVMTIMFMAAQTNNASVLEAIVNNSTACDCLGYDFLKIVARVPSDFTLQQMIEVLRDKKEPFHVAIDRNMMNIRAGDFRRVIQMQGNDFLF